MQTSALSTPYDPGPHYLLGHPFITFKAVRPSVPFLHQSPLVGDQLLLWKLTVGILSGSYLSSSWSREQAANRPPPFRVSPLSEKASRVHSSKSIMQNITKVEIQAQPAYSPAHPGVPQQQPGGLFWPSWLICRFLKVTKVKTQLEYLSPETTLRSRRNAFGCTWRDENERFCSGLCYQH